MVIYGHVSGQPLALDTVKHDRWNPLRPAVANNLLPLREMRKNKLCHSPLSEQKGVSPDEKVPRERWGS